MTSPNRNHHTGKSGLALLAAIKISSRDKKAWVAVIISALILIGCLYVRISN